MSRKELAEVVGVSPQQIVKYENGQNMVSLGRLSLIAKKLKKRESSFLCDNNLLEQGILDRESSLSLSLHKLLNKIENKEQLKAIYVLCKALVK